MFLSTNCYSIFPSLLPGFSMWHFVINFPDPASVYVSVNILNLFFNFQDQTDYRKADKDAYSQLASALDDANFDAISIEDTHRRNDVQLFSKFKKMKVSTCLMHGRPI